MVLGESGRQVNQEHAAVAALTPQTCVIHANHRFGAESYAACVSPCGALLVIRTSSNGGICIYRFDHEAAPNVRWHTRVYH